MTTYTYSLSSDFGGSLGLRQFHDEIEAEGGITTSLDGVSLTGDVVTIHFSGSLSGGEQTTLSNLIGVHTEDTSAVTTTHFSLIPLVNEVSTSSYKYIASYIYPGSSINKIFYIKVLSYMDASITNYSVRVRDITNDADIAEGTFTNTSEAVNSLGTISNLPTGEAVFEIQLKRTGGSSKKNAYVNAVTIYL